MGCLGALLDIRASGWMSGPASVRVLAGGVLFGAGPVLVLLGATVTAWPAFVPKSV